MASDNHEKKNNDGIAWHTLTNLKPIQMDKVQKEAEKKRRSMLIYGRDDMHSYIL